MKILQISTKKPYPPIDGGRIVSYNTIKYLAMRGHSITLVSIVDKKEKIPELKKICKWIPIQKNTFTSILGLLSNLFLKTPYTISKYYSKKVKDTIRKILSKENFDIVHIDHLHMAYCGEFIQREFGLPIVLREHNVETTIMKRFYKNQKNPIIKFYAYLQWKKLYKYETKICEIFDKCLMITEEDKKKIEDMNSKVKTFIIPAGVDVSYFYPLKTEEEPYSLIFVGSMKWLPNIDAVLWFCNEFWSKLKKVFPEVKLYVVGQKPSKEITELGKKDKDIIITGFVKDIRPYVAKSSLYIVPLRIGGGMRLKILEAMAMGKPVISTSIGAEGIEAVDEKDIIIADDVERFVEKIIELLKDKNYRRKIAQNGEKLVKEKYRWESIVKKLEKEYMEAIESIEARRKQSGT